MSEQKLETNEGNSWLVFLIIGLVGQGARVLSSKSHVVVGEATSAFTSRLALQSSKAIPRLIPAPQNTANFEQTNVFQSEIAPNELLKLRDSLRADQRTVNIDWSLGEPKDQQREGACTAYALAAAVESLLKSRYQIDAQVDAQYFWESYKIPYMTHALKAAVLPNSALFATVKSESKLHPFKAGTILHVRMKESDFEVLKLSKLAFAISDKIPVILLTSVDSGVSSMKTSQTGYIYASRQSKSSSHAMLMSGVSRGLKKQGDIWFHIRNSWGADWGKNGSTYLDSYHCLINNCDYIGIKRILVSEIKQNSPEAIAYAASKNISAVATAGAAVNSQSPDRTITDQNIEQQDENEISKIVKEMTENSGAPQRSFQL